MRHILEELTNNEAEWRLAGECVGQIEELLGKGEKPLIVITSRGSLRDVLASGRHNEGFSALTGQARWAATATDLDSANQKVVAVPDEQKPEGPNLLATRHALAELFHAGATIVVESGSKPS